MDYSQFLHMREELSLVVVLLLLFLADLFMSPDAHKNDGKARLNTMLLLLQFVELPYDTVIII